MTDARPLESIEDALARAEAEPYQAEIVQDQRVGPFAWYISFGKGLMEITPGRFAWTKRQAERKAERLMARWQRQDERRRASRTVVNA